MKHIRTVFFPSACLSLLLATSGAFAADKVCKVDIAGTDQMQFDKKEIAIAADCTEVEVTLKHTGKLPAQAMGHNWVLVKTADAQPVANDGLSAGFANDHIKKGDTRVIAHTKIVGGGQTTTVKFPTSLLKKGEAYTYLCSFPGHVALMKGTLKFGSFPGNAMDQRLADLQQQFDLERLEVNLFRGESRDTGSPQVFGGQVLGQALMAAHYTIDDGRVVHSMHAYFLRRGDFTKPIVYHVDRSRDGGSFSARRVVAVQNGEQIFTCSASFQAEEKGLEYQASAPQVPPPEDLKPLTKPPQSELDKLPEKLQRWLEIKRPFEFRPVQEYNPLAPVACAPTRQIWMRAVDKLPDDDTLHRCLLAYISDYWLLDTSTMPHGSSFLRGNLVMASIDHAIWFHRPARVDEWLLYSLDSPSSSGARGFARGTFYTRSGVLVASTAQEGLIRLVQSPS